MSTARKVVATPFGDVSYYGTEPASIEPEWPSFVRTRLSYYERLLRRNDIAVDRHLNAARMHAWYSRQL
jgi:hypothetical protein